MKIGKKLMVSFSAILVLTLIVGAIGWIQMTSLNHTYQNMLDDRVQKIQWVKDLKYLAADQSKNVRGYLITGDSGQLEAYEVDRAAFADTWQTLHDSFYTERSIALSTQLRDQEAQYAEVVAEISSFKAAGDNETYVRLVEEKCVPLAAALASTAQELENFQRQQLQEAQQATAAGVEQVKQVLIGVLLAATIVGIALALLITRIISRPVIAVSEAAGRIASGDLTGPDIKLRQRDEIGQMANSFNEMKLQLRTLMGTIHQNAQEVSVASRDLSSGSEQAAAGSGAIAEAVQAISESAATQVTRIKHNQSAMQESVESLQRIAHSASITAESSAEAMARAEQGGQLLEQAVVQIGQIRNKMTHQTELINALGEQSQRIDQITLFIKELAAQTNLLSLNAAIEAARAGEHGRGFAVVASEVKKLAEQSGEASGRIADEIQHMVDGIRTAMDEMNQGAIEMKAGAASIDATGEAFTAVREAIATVAEQAQEVSAATEEITAMTEQILTAEEELVQLSGKISDESQSVAAVCEEQLASSEEMSASAETLSHMSQHLMGEIGKFRFEQVGAAVIDVPAASGGSEEKRSTLAAVS
ncbi:methyl-accepting chemotaxis protein [Paenibacillus sp. 1P07SE]|uniref:methyl-accepting chemotaxis protein n=1 Tax=Paenibacillus sp. 1P07SE TaxID=3132209 RepID=UPI0039A57FC9